MPSSRIIWDWGTAYDMFVSLEVLHDPGSFGVRGSWAAGVRARLPIKERELLEHARLLVRVPFHWLYGLPKPKNGAAVLWALGQIPAAERLPALALTPGKPMNEVAHLLQRVSKGGCCNDAEREAIRWACGYERGSTDALSPEELELILSWWAASEDFGERYLDALRIYHEVFFAEEEQRIEPSLEQALSRAQPLAKKRDLLDLVQELSQGVRLSDLNPSDQVVLVPSYWCTPLIFLGKASPELKMYLYGARPTDASLVPGEMIPEMLLRALKALSDPTRLRILHILAEDMLTPAELSRRLRLRAPTVTHHLKILRLAGLVNLTIENMANGKEVNLYATRQESLSTVCASLQHFLGHKHTEEPSFQAMALADKEHILD